jgi:uncharacterized protein
MAQLGLKRVGVVAVLIAAICGGLAMQGNCNETAHDAKVKAKAVKAAAAAKKKPKGPPPITPPVRDPQHQFQLQPRDYIELKRRNVVMQKRDFSCGAAAVATICKYYWGDNVDEDLFLRALDDILTDAEIKDRIENGLAISDLRRAAVRVGYQAVIGKTTFAKLREVKVPVVVGIEPEGHKHFVVYRGQDGKYVYVADSIRGNVRMPIRDFTKQWQENAVLVIHKPGRKVRETSPLTVTCEEMSLGDLNDQLIRALPSQQLPERAQTSRP